MLQLQERSAAGSARRGGIFSRIVVVLGELLITAGVIVLLFVAWQLWWTNVASDARQRDAVREFTRNVEIPAVPAPSSAVDYGQPKVSAEPGRAQPSALCMFRGSVRTTPGPWSKEPRPPCWIHSE